MRKQVLALSCSAIFSCALFCSGQTLRSTVRVPASSVRGRITIDEVVGREPQTNPIPKLKIYLFRADDTKALVELQEACRRGMKDPGANLMRAYDTCSQNLRRVVEMVPTLPAVSVCRLAPAGMYVDPSIWATGV